MQIVGCYPQEYGWLVERAGCDVTPGFQAIKAIDDSGRIHGMVGYGNWTENSVLMHIALENPAAFRSILTMAFRLPFEMANRGVALATVRAKNERSMRLCQRVGFREAYRVKDGIAVGEDLVLFEMRRENCRFIPEQMRKAA